jgi:glyceraldehyde-3-phosphate dehydrogenase (NADP+)
VVVCDKIDSTPAEVDMVESGSRPARSPFPERADIPERFSPEVHDAGLSLLIDGHVSRWSGETRPLQSAVCVHTPEGGLAQVELGPAAWPAESQGRAALAAAARAWKGGRGDWPRASVSERCACVRDFLKRLAPLRDRVTCNLMWEVGKPIKDCIIEFDRTVAYIEDTLTTLEDMERSSALPSVASGFAARIRRAPLGVTLCMGPYNYAINEVYTLVIPALVMGNPVVMKTPRYGVQANALLLPALAESFPPGVVNAVTGDGATLVGPMMESGLVDVLAFIGSARTATVLLKQHPHPNRLRTVLGLGAKNPAIVLADADCDAAAAEIVSGALTFGGQRCTAIKQVLVAHPVAERLAEAITARVSALKVGMPWEEGVVVTPIPDRKHLDFLAGLVRDAVAQGSRITNAGGGEVVGTLIQPAVLYPVGKAAQVFSQEQFGPLIPISVFDDPSEALDVLDQSNVGQQASLFGSDPKAIGPLVDHLANLVCRVNLGTQCRRGPDSFPFTGRKDSAIGTLSLSDALRVFSIRSIVAATEKDRARLEALSETSRFLAPPAAPNA